MLIFPWAGDSIGVGGAHPHGPHEGRGACGAAVSVARHGKAKEDHSEDLQGAHP